MKKEHSTTRSVIFTPHNTRKIAENKKIMVGYECTLGKKEPQHQSTTQLPRFGQGQITLSISVQVMIITIENRNMYLVKPRLDFKTYSPDGDISKTSTQTNKSNLRVPSSSL